MSEIITKEEQQFLLDWIFSNENKFKPNDAGPNRKFIKLNDLKIFEKPKLILEIKKRILIKEEIIVWYEDPFFGDLITCNTEGGYVHEHTDKTLPDREHIRFNLFLSKPEKGGDPILMGKIMDFKERGYLKYHVNRQVHKSLPVEGDKPRIAISYGISIPTDPGSIA